MTNLSPVNIKSIPMRAINAVDKPARESSLGAWVCVVIFLAFIVSCWLFGIAKVLIAIAVLIVLCAVVAGVVAESGSKHEGLVRK